MSAQGSVLGKPAPFEPTLAAARARLAAVRVHDYARTRNAIDGAVTRLSPYITHGLLALPEVARDVAARSRIDVQHKFIYELGWREFFRHAWRHNGEGIFTSLHAGVLPDDAYARELPADIREARTGVPAIDEAVHTLYATGYLHNHARMWLASYVVHLRRVHWRAGADWLYAHLLDGDLASNHLSWQWVAATGSHRPYLFNADNVAKYAPRAWHSPGTVIAADYAALERIARGAALPQAGGALVGTAEPAMLRAPPSGLFSAPDAAAVQGRDVWLLHPWNLGEPLAHALCVAVCVSEFHTRWPWSAARWHFVGTRMRAAAGLAWHGSAAQIREALAGARSVRTVFEPHLAGTGLFAGMQALPAPRLFGEPPRPCRSFSQFWSQVTRGVNTLDELPGFQTNEETSS